MSDRGDIVRRKLRRLEPEYIKAVASVGLKEGRYADSPEWTERCAEAFELISVRLAGPAPSSSDAACFTLGRICEIVDSVREPLAVISEYERLHADLKRIDEHERATKTG